MFESFFPPHIQSGQSNRLYDFTLAPPEGFTSQNTQDFNRLISVDYDTTIHIRQVHGDHIVSITSENINDYQPLEADAMITSLSNVALLIRTADCLPVFICDSKHDVIALVHAGWKGVQKEIVSKTIHKMCEQYSAQIKDIHVAIGASIQKCCFEVTYEFCDFFPNSILHRGELMFCDLQAQQREQLHTIGIQDSHIFDTNECSCCQSQYHSYRRDSLSAGRMLSWIMIRG